MDTLSKLIEFMADERLSREDAIIALGGGVTGDIAGFAASCYLRGIPYAQIPTTLLSAVDSSVGGKTGINLTKGKNLAGAFWQPSLVLCDYSVFDTLPAEDLLDGAAEAIKYGVIADRSLFDFMLSNSADSLYKNDSFEYIIKKCIEIKSALVSEDERDTGRRRLLNFGHTIGHAIEKLSGYSVSHGHAVALGMLHISRAAYKAGFSAADCTVEIERVLKKYGFSLSHNYSADELYEAALSDKKRLGDRITLVIPDEIGACRLEKIDISLFKEFIARGG
jgi:3-dehydroquinate synthase